MVALDLAYAQRPLKIMLGVCVSKQGYEPDFAHRFFPFVHRIGAVVKVVDGDALLPRARSLIATAFLQHPERPDVLLTLDTDVLIRQDDAVRLCQQAMDHGLVGALYVTRRQPHRPAVELLPGVPVTFPAPGTVDPDRVAPVEVEYLATGALAISRRAVQRIVDHHQLPLCQPESPTGRLYPLYPDGPHQRADGAWEYLSEDYGLCRLAREAGVGVFLNPGIRVVHATGPGTGLVLEDLVPGLAAGGPVTLTLTRKADRSGYLIEVHRDAPVADDGEAVEDGEAGAAVNGAADEESES